MSSRLRFAIPSALSLLALYLALSGGTFAGAQGVPDVGGVPPGTITAFGGPIPPPGWLPADGSEVSRAQFPELFAAIGTTYGAGNGTTTFNLPDLRGRVPVGADGTAGRLSANDALGESGGAEKHKLTAAESGLPAHFHYGSDAGYSSGVPGMQRQVTSQADGANSWRTNTSPAQDASQAHSIMQPYQVVNYIVKQ